MAAKTTIMIDDDVRDVLTRSTFDKEGLKLPAQLDRALYLKTMKVLEAYGGRWNKKRGGIDLLSHQIPPLQEALETGVAVRKKVVDQAYYTPPELADLLVKHTREIALPKSRTLPDAWRVLEPSAGEGALIEALRRRWPMQHIDVEAIERDPATCDRLRQKVAYPVVGNTHIGCGDFLGLAPAAWHARGAAFDLVLMNPPWTKGQALKHVHHALKFLKRGGVLGAIVPQNFSTHELDTVLYIEEFDVPPGSFKSSGTMVHAKIVVCR